MDVPYAHIYDKLIKSLSQNIEKYVINSQHSYRILIRWKWLSNVSKKITSIPDPLVHWLIHEEIFKT